MKLSFARLNQELVRPRARPARRRRPAVRRLDDAPPDARPTSSARTRASATCAPRATRSRAAPPRSCATSSPSGSSACPPSPASTRTSRGRTCPDDHDCSRGRRPARRRRRARPARLGAQGARQALRRPTRLNGLYDGTDEVVRPAVVGASASSGSPGCWCPRRSAAPGRRPARPPWCWRSSAARSRPRRS